MTIKEQFEVLELQEYKFSLINEINSLKEQCVLEKNTEYLYKCILLISDVYIEHQNFDDALNLLLKEVKTLDKTIFKHLYYDFLDRIIYLYINKRNYSVAIRYIAQKEKIINKNDSDVVNRLNLEYSYVYGYMNDPDKALEYLKQIVNNNPSKDLKSIVYSNLTKIYIDKKDVKQAKEYLDICIALSDDHESAVYNDYLLAKICVLEGNNSFALQLYENIFITEEINSMTLSMMNEYLSLLNELKKYNKSLLLMNKLSIFVNATTDLFILRDFYKNKLDYFIGVKDNNNAQITKKELENIEKIIIENEKSILNANIEEDLNDIKEKTEEETFNKIDTLTSLVDTALKGNTLREVIIDFSVKVQNIINFDELQFIIFNHIDEKEYQMSDGISCFKYRNKRLYEKKVPYEDLKGSIVELMINSNKPVVIDFNDFNVDVKDVFSNSIYNREVLKYLNAIPCVYKDDVFASVIYSSRDTDLTNHSNTILLKIATKLIESSLIIQFSEENVKRYEQLNNFITDEYKVGLFQLNNKTIYFSNALKEMLSFKQNTISLDSYIKRISKSDYNKYIDHLNLDKKTTIKYKFELQDKIIELEEVLDPVKDLSGKVLYYQGLIKSLSSESVGYALSHKDLLNKIEELKLKTSSIEFKFSIIKIMESVDKYQYIKNTFGVEPYYLNDGSFIVVLENECNQRTLDKLCKPFISKCSVIRYPRDIINIDEMLEVTNIMIEQQKMHFDNDVYRYFIKKNNLINKLENILNNNFELNALQYKCYDDSIMYEIKPVIYGIDDREIVNDYLKGKILLEFENKFIESFLNCKFNEKSFITLSNSSLYKLLTEYNLEDIEYIDVVMKENNELTALIFDKLKKVNKGVYIDYSLISKIDAYYFTTGIIKGIFVGNNINVDVNKIFRILNMFNLSLICYNNVFDYDKACYYNNIKKKIN